MNQYDRIKAQLRKINGADKSEKPEQPLPPVKKPRAIRTRKDRSPSRGNPKINAGKYRNCHPDYLRGLIESTGLSVVSVARRIDIHERTLHCYLAPMDRKSHLDAPYTVQVAIEALAS